MTDYPQLEDRWMAPAQDERVMTRAEVTELGQDPDWSARCWPPLRPPPIRQRYVRPVRIALAVGVLADVTVFILACMGVI